MICNVTWFSTVFQSYQADGQVIMEGHMQWSPISDWKDLCLRQGSNMGPQLNRGSCYTFNPIALRKAKIAYNFGLSEPNRVKWMGTLSGVAPIPVPFLPPFSLKGEQILSFQCRPLCWKGSFFQGTKQVKSCFPLYKRWMDVWIPIMSFSTIFQSYRDNGRVIMKGCVQYGTLFMTGKISTRACRTSVQHLTHWATLTHMKPCLDKPSCSKQPKLRKKNLHRLQCS